MSGVSFHLKPLEAELQRQCLCCIAATHAREDTEAEAEAEDDSEAR